METYITISTLNDFIFCPRSIYFHKLYGKYNKKIYQEKSQTVGSIKHENIDKKKYSTAKKYLQSLDVFSEKFGLCGKIDLYDKEQCFLIERKNKIKVIYDGYKYQIWAQALCLTEMKYRIKKMFLHSLSDNKRYEIPFPTKKEQKSFFENIEKMHQFDINNQDFQPNIHKCQKCIYSELCDCSIK